MTRNIPAGSLTKQPALASHYRAVGPAAIVAALLHATRKKKPAQKTITPARLEKPTACVGDEG